MALQNDRKYDILINPNGISEPKKRLREDTSKSVICNADTANVHFRILDSVDYKVIKACMLVFVQHVLANSKGLYEVTRDLVASSVRINKKLYNEIIDIHKKGTRNFRSAHLTFANQRYLFRKFIELKTTHMEYKYLIMALLAVVQLDIKRLNKIAKDCHPRAFQPLEQAVLDIFAKDEIFKDYIIQVDIMNMKNQMLSMQIARLKDLGIIPEDYTLNHAELGSKDHLAVLQLILKYKNILNVKHWVEKDYISLIEELKAKHYNPQG